MLTQGESMSTSFFRSIAAVAAVGVGVLSFIAGPVSAQECYPPTEGCVTTTSAPPAAGPSITLSDTTVTRGQRVNAVIAGFDPGTSGIITISTGSGEQQVGTFAVGSGGTVTTSFTIPTNISLGAHTVFARGTVNGAAASASQAINVVDDAGVGAGGTGTGSGTSGLARTGVYLIPALVIGLGLVAGGVALKHSGKRRGTSSTAS
jgi:hypothetical protein